MQSWDSAQYLKFEAERTRPCRDLITAIPLQAPARIVDLGCGPGNSTAALAARWPGAAITGVDSSPAMLDQARADHPQITWAHGDIATWTAGTPCDLVFSNAALQWVPDHATVYPHLLSQVAPGGALAIQVPANIDAAAHSLMRELAASPFWKHYFPEPVREWHAHPAEYYYDLLAPLTPHVDLWYTDYQHILDGPAAIAEWYRGTGLRPFLAALPEDAREGFIAEYTDRLSVAFPLRPDGRVIFPFRRLFLIALVP
jgi:trans-aconitate 2-methyltransferase